MIIFDLFIVKKNVKMKKLLGEKKSNPLVKYMIDYHNDISYEINQEFYI